MNAVAQNARQVISEFRDSLDGQRLYHENRRNNSEAYRLKNILSEYDTKTYSTKKWLDEQPKPKKKNAQVL